MLLGGFDGDGFAERVAGADVGGDFEFVVELFRWSEFGCGGFGWFGLSAGPADVGSTYDQRRGSAMVADGDPFVVGQERLVGAEELSDVCCVVDGRVEVGVVSDGYWFDEVGVGGWD